MCRLSVFQDDLAFLKRGESLSSEVTVPFTPLAAKQKDRLLLLNSCGHLGPKLCELQAG